MTSVLRQTSAFMAHQKPVVGDMKMSFVGYNHLGWMLCNGDSLLIADNELLYKVIGKQFGSVDATHFNLPNPAGRVAGVVGNNSIVGTITHPPGQVIGEEEHILLYTEMPAHNHDTAGRTTNLPYTAAPGNTSTNGLHNHGITDPGHIHGITDPGHNHAITDPTHQHDYASPSAFDLSTLAPRTDASDNVFNDTRQTAFASTGISINNNTTGITINNNVTSITINNDGLHNHTIASNGMDQPHNNMQPTLFMGNMFIYSGVPTLGYWPYTIGMDAPEFMTPALNPPLI